MLRSWLAGEDMSSRPTKLSFLTEVDIVHLLESKGGNLLTIKLDSVFKCYISCFCSNMSH